MILLPLLAAGCLETQYTVHEADPEPVVISPNVLPLLRGDDACEPHEVTLQGPDTLTGVVWEPTSGRPSDVLLPDFEAAELEDGFTFSFDYCPWDDTPAAGALRFAFEQSNTALVWAEET